MIATLNKDQTDRVLRAAVIGVGRGGTGGAGAHSIGYAHADAYTASARFSLVGAADIAADNLEAFATHYSVAETSTELVNLLRSVNPDVVSICTYAGSHRQIVESCVAAGVKGIFCEKPLALSMDDCLAIQSLADRTGVKVIVNHQRRYLHRFTECRRLVQAGAIGRPVEFVAGIEGWDLMEWGTHWLDMFRFFANDQPVDWIMGQVRCSGEKKGYGHLMEDHAVAYFAFADGTRGLLDGGKALPSSAAMRLIGDEGMIEIPERAPVRLLGSGGWSTVETRTSAHRPNEFGSPADSAWTKVLDSFVAWLDGGTAPEIALANALRSSELYLAAYESSLRGDRVDLPLNSQGRFPLDRIVARRAQSLAPSNFGVPGSDHVGAILD